MSTIDQTVINGFLAADKVVNDNFSSVFTKQDVLEILKIAKFDMVKSLEDVKQQVMFLGPTYSADQVKSAVRDALSDNDITDLLFIQVEDAEFSINGNQISIDYVPAEFDIEQIVKRIESHLE